MTQEQLAEAIGKSTDTVSNIETGRLSTRIENASRLAQALGVSLSTLFDIKDPQDTLDQNHKKAVESLITLISPLSKESIEKITMLVRIALDLKE